MYSSWGSNSISTISQSLNAPIRGTKGPKEDVPPEPPQPSRPGVQRRLNGVLQRRRILSIGTIVSIRSIGYSMLHVSTNVSNTELYEATCPHGRLECASGQEYWFLTASSAASRRVYHCHGRLQGALTLGLWNAMSLCHDRSSALVILGRRAGDAHDISPDCYQKIGAARGAVLSERWAARTCHLWGAAANRWEEFGRVEDLPGMGWTELSDLHLLLCYPHSGAYRQRDQVSESVLVRGKKGSQCCVRQDKKKPWVMAVAVVCIMHPCVHVPRFLAVSSNLILTVYWPHYNLRVATATHMSWTYVTLRLHAEMVTRPFVTEANAILVQTDHAVAVHRMAFVSSEALCPSSFRGD